MARSYAEIQDVVEQILQDTGATTYVTTETGYGIEEGLKELGRHDPHIVLVTFKIEARTGTATSGTTTNTLEDSTSDHFLATDDANEKVVYNTTDKTWAVITSIAADGDTVTISNDIMVSGEGYKIYNKHCYNNRQIYIGDVGDYLWIDRVEYKCNKSPRSWRNWELYGDVLEIDIDFTPTDEDEVNVYFARPHILCQLTDWKGEVHTAGTAGDTTMQIKSFFDTDVVEIGDEFYIVGHRALYTITKGVTLNYQVAAGSEIGFYPPLEAAAPGDAVINFTKSTLQPQHEEIFCNLVAARAAISKGAKFLQQIQTAITTLTNVDGIINTMAAEITQAGVDLASGRTAAALTPAIITKAETAIGLVQNQITPAIANMHTGQALINEVNIGGVNVPTNYANYATTALNNAKAFADQARINLQQATADESVARSYTALASGELNKATAQLNQAGGYIREVTSRLNVASSFRLYQDWGERKLAEAKMELETLSPVRTSRVYPKD